MLRNNVNPSPIFFDNHDDPITGLVLERLVSEFERLGYDSYFDEAPSITIEKRLQCIVDNQKLHKKSGRTVDPDVLESSFKAFLIQLKKSKINYRGIDLLLSPRQIHFLLSSIDTRDQYMTESYLTTNLSVFSKMGFRHLPGIQREILKKLSIERASAQFCFFYIYSIKPAADPDQFEQRLREAEIDLPLGVIRINAIGRKAHELDDIVKTVLRELEIRKRKLHELLRSELQQSNVFSKDRLFALDEAKVSVDEQVQLQSLNLRTIKDEQVTSNEHLEQLRPLGLTHR